MSRWLPALLLTASLLAQVSPDGAILGVVKDSSGAALPSATVKVTNLETGLVQSATSDQHGNFEILALPRGPYSVNVSAPQFSTWQIQRVDLTLGEMKRVFPVLQVGDVKQQITVAGGVELVQTEKASVETAIEQRQIRDLPLNGRNPVELVALVPGMRYISGGIGRGNEYTVQGLGTREDQTGFSIDGQDANDPSEEKGTSIPNLDTVAQFNVQTNSFTAENGRNPLQVMIVTKGGGNQFHGTLWEFHRNFAVEARNAFAPPGPNPKAIRNQYGFSAGGPIRKNRTFYFVSDEWLNLREERIYNNTTAIPAALLQGDFSARTRKPTDPLNNNAAFPNNKIPLDRISKASQFLFPYLLQPNSDGGAFRGLAAQPSDSSNLTLRIDQQLTASQRVYLRWIRIAKNQFTAGYRPDYSMTTNTHQHNIGLNYTWSITPTTLFTLVGGYFQTDTFLATPQAGRENLANLAGIQGFPTAGREDAIGLPNVTITGYAGFSLPANTPGRFAREDVGGKASLNLIRRAHNVGFGYEYNDRRTLAHHASASPRGSFTFNNQYTGDGFADYLLGLLANDERNYPLAAFAMAHSPYSAFYVQDYWRIHPNITVTLGLRYDRWHEKGLVRNVGATFDPVRGKLIAADDGNGKIDVTAQPVTPFLAAATQGQWITATEAGVPRGLFQATGYASPRMGIAWRPFGKEDLVVRGGYGIYTSSYNGNITGSQVIGPPYWTQERQTFVRATLQRWETAFPADPRAFITPAVAAAAYNVKPMKIQQFNLSLQKTVPWVRSAVTVSYVGNRGEDLITRHDYNEVKPALYTNLQSARPYPLLATIRIYENIGRSWYNSFQLKAERRFTHGFSCLISYAFSRNIDEFGSSITDGPTPFAPSGYDRGRSELERRHIAAANAVWEIPVGRGRAHFSQVPSALNFVVGGWQLSGTYSVVSGNPLIILTPGDILGNGYTPARERPNLVGDPRVDQPGANLWFNPSAFQNPAAYTFGNAGLGLIDGPGNHVVNTSLAKNFAIREAKYFQVRFEGFNTLNHVNLNNPGTTLGQTNTARISGSADARQLQFGLKFVF